MLRYVTISIDFVSLFVSAESISLGACHVVVVLCTDVVSTGQVAGRRWSVERVL